MYKHFEVWLNHGHFAVLNDDGVKIVEESSVTRTAKNSVRTTIGEILKGDKGERPAFTAWYNNNINNLEDLNAR